MVALGGEPVQFVVATDISLQFLQVTTDPNFVFRVYEKVALRIKGEHAIGLLAPAAPPTSTAAISRDGRGGRNRRRWQGRETAQIGTPAEKEQTKKEPTTAG